MFDFSMFNDLSQSLQFGKKIQGKPETNLHWQNYYANHKDI